MSNLVPTSPLMQPVLWHGQEYFTSQYFHQQYRQNLAEAGQEGKYREHRHFLQAIRLIPAYDTFAANHHIVLVTWQEVKTTNLPDKSVSAFNELQKLFALTGYQPLTLLDHSAQIELMHHLEDEVSKEMAYRHSHHTATQLASRKASTPLPTELAARELAAWQEIGRMLGTPEYIVQQEAAKQIAATTGINLRPLLLAAPAQQTIAPEDVMLEPADLAKALGFKSGYALNCALETLGWQVRSIAGGWEPTPTGAPYAAQHAWTAEHGTKSGFNYKWKKQAVLDACTSAGLQPPAQQEGV